MLQISDLHLVELLPFCIGLQYYHRETTLGSFILPADVLGVDITIQHRSRGIPLHCMCIFFLNFYPSRVLGRQLWVLLVRWASQMAQQVKKPPAMQETQVQSLDQEDPLEEDTENPLQYSCLKNPMDWEAWRAIVHGVAKGQMRLSHWAQQQWGLSLLLCWVRKTWAPGTWGPCTVTQRIPS